LFKLAFYLIIIIKEGETINITGDLYFFHPLVLQIKYDI